MKLMNQAITIRKIQPDDDRAVSEVAKTLGAPERYFAYLSYKRGKANALAAVDGERVVGCVVPRVARIAGEKIGMVDWIFVDRNVQGKGAGKALLDAVLSYFQEEGCKTLYALIDRYNSPSWNMFFHRGFMPFEFDRQFKVFGWRIISLWWIVSYFIAPGHFIVRKTVKEEQLAGEIGDGRHFLVAWLGFSFVAWIVGLRYDAPVLTSIPFALGVVGISIFAHELAHKLIARLFGLKTVFKANELGLLFSAPFSLLVGVHYPTYGSTYIKQKDWPYNKNLREMGLIYVAGPVVSLVLAFCFLGLTHWGDREWLEALGRVGFWTNFSLGSFNLLPIPMLDGNKIFLGNKTIGVLLILGFVLLWLLKRFYVQ
ncbi:GNAT family N-acetyltransferase [Dehalococcoidia bacterium]|nr:GNAT family N-acetyltransferase [Dehalococcoidia bacterium]